MNTDKWNALKAKLAEKFRYLRLDEDFEIDDDLRVEERTITQDRADTSSGDPKKMLLYRRIILVVLVVCIVGGFYLYNQLHLFTDYVIVNSYENEVESGTKYVSAGKYIYRYNSDGISCVNRKNELKWSITYNMQAPIADICGDTVVIAEQQGNQIYIVNKDGQIGNFETVLPILKVRVSKQGVVAAVLQEEGVTWVNMYQPDGTSIAEDKTSVEESGYPLDIDISPDGQKLAVSYLAVNNAILRSDVVFYHFGSAGQSAENHIVSSTTYLEHVIPEIYFTDNASAVAVMDSGFAVFKGSDAPEESTVVTFTDEIISTFHDDSRIGFLFHSEKEDFIYRMEIYGYNGHRKTSKDINARYKHIKIENNQILMFNGEGCDVFTMSGRKRFSSAYEKEIVDMFYFSEFRKYLIITKDSFDKIRISG